MLQRTASRTHAPPTQPPPHQCHIERRTQLRPGQLTVPPACLVTTTACAKLSADKRWSSSAMRHHTAAAAPRWLAAAALCCVVGHGVEAGNGKIVAVPHGNRVPDGAGDCPLGLSQSAFRCFPGRCVAATKRATHAADLACVLQYQCRLECGCQPSRCRALCKVLLCTIAVAVGGPTGADDHCRAPPHVLCDRHGLEEGRNRH